MNRSEEIKEQMKVDGASDKDAMAYEKMFDALSKEPSFELGESFAASVASRVEKMDRKKGFWYFGLAFMGIAIMLIVFCAVMIASYGIDSIIQFKQVSTWGVFVGVVIAVIQYLDNKLVRKNSPLTI